MRWIDCKQPVTRLIEYIIFSKNPAVNFSFKTEILTKIMRWIDANKLQLDLHKTLFSVTNHLTTSVSKISEVDLDKAPNTDTLDMIIYEKFVFKDHVNKLDQPET